jgi:hypothetical protein
MAGHGGAREGAGRKTKAEELEIPSLIEDVIGIDGKKEILKKLWEKAKTGSFPHLQLLAHYTFGKPQDKIDLTSKGNEIFTKEIVFRKYGDKP